MNVNKQRKIMKKQAVNFIRQDAHKIEHFFLPDDFKYYREKLFGHGVAVVITIEYVSLAKLEEEFSVTP